MCTVLKVAIAKLIHFIRTVVSCGRLSGPTNGDVSFTSTSVNSKATYSCNNGFLLVGQTTRICQSNGEWSRIAPVCKSKTESIIMSKCSVKCTCMREMSLEIFSKIVIGPDTNNS